MANYIYDYATSRLSVIHSYNMAQDIIDKAFTYSKAGDILSKADNRANITYTYEYDHNHRLISEKTAGASAVPGSSVEVIEFTYDDTPGKPVHAPASITKNDSLTEYAYTETGNRTYKNDGFETTTYESNADNMISRITINGTVTEFLYDADNKRIKKTQGLKTTLYFGERFEIINGTPTLYVFAGNLRVAQVTDTDLQYFHKDHLGSTCAMSRQDGTIIDFGEYYPYGLDREANALLQFSPYKFTDQEQDDGTGLYNYDARLYDPVLGQFIMADSIVPEIYNPQSLNRYAYCLNNPVRYVDPSGHEPEGDGDQSNGGWGNSGSEAAWGGGEEPGRGMADAGGRDGTGWGGSPTPSQRSALNHIHSVDILNRTRVINGRTYDLAQLIHDNPLVKDATGIFRGIIARNKSALLRFNFGRKADSLFVGKRAVAMEKQRISQLFDGEDTILSPKAFIRALSVTSTVLTIGACFPGPHSAPMAGSAVALDATSAFLGQSVAPMTGNLVNAAASQLGTKAGILGKSFSVGFSVGSTINSFMD